MGPQVGQRGAAATTQAAAAAPSNTVEAFFTAQPLAGAKVDYKSYYVNQAARNIAEDISASFPNTFETIFAKKL